MCVCVCVSQSDTVSTVLLALVNDFSCNSINIIHLNTLMLPLNNTTTLSAVKHSLALTLNSEWLTLHTHTGQREWVSISGWKTLMSWFNQCKNSIENRHTHAADGYYWVLMCTQHRSLRLFFTSLTPASAKHRRLLK